MFKTSILLYIVCFGCYVLFTREPDYFESEKITVQITDSLNHFKANYTIEDKKYSLNADYLFRTFSKNEKVVVIYNPNKPKLAAIYCIWGYWLRWQELIVSTILIIGLYYLATSITKNPDAVSYLQQQQQETSPQRKYT